MKSIVMRGWLGWGNRRGPLDTYGPGGRWYTGPIYEATAQERDRTEVGDELADALKREGAEEGMHLVVIAVDRFFDMDRLAEIEDRIATELSVEPVRAAPGCEVER